MGRMRDEINMSWITGLELYYTPESPGCRAVLMCVHELDLDVEMIKLDMYQKYEHRKPWFVRMNPQHTVPTINDNGYVLWESRAILQYLVSKYGSHKSELYPLEPEARSVVDRILFFDIGTLYRSLLDYFHPQMISGDDPDERKGNAFKQALEYLDQFLETSSYVAGDNLTIADFSILASVTHLEGLDYRIAAYKNVTKWVERLKRELPYYEKCNSAGIEAFRIWARNVKSNKALNKQK